MKSPLSFRPNLPAYRAESITLTSLGKILNEFNSSMFDAERTDTHMRSIGFNVQNPLPPRLFDDQLHYDIFYKAEEMNELCPSHEGDEFMGDVTQIILPRLCSYYLHELWLEGEVADTVGVLGGELVCAKGYITNQTRRNVETMLLVLYGDYYESVSPLRRKITNALHALGKLVNWQEQGLTAYARHDADGSCIENVLVVRGCAEEVAKRLHAARVPFPYRLSTHKAIQFQRAASVCLYDVNGDITDGAADDEDFVRRLLAHYRITKLQLLIS